MCCSIKCLVNKDVCFLIYYKLCRRPVAVATERRRAIWAAYVTMTSLSTTRSALSQLLPRSRLVQSKNRIFAYMTRSVALAAHPLWGAFCYSYIAKPFCSDQLSLLPSVGWKINSSLEATGLRPSVVDWDGDMSACCKLWVQLFGDVGNWWPHSALRYH